MHYAKTTAIAVAALSAGAGASIVAPMADTYLQSDGTQAIDTGYYANESTKVIIDFEPTQTNDTRYVFGAADPGSGSGLALSLKQAATGLTIQMSRDRNFNPIPVPSKTRYTATFDCTAGTASLTKYSGTPFEETCSASVGSTINPTTNSLPIAILARRVSGGFGQPFIGKLYSMKIYDGETLVRDFIPYGFGATTGLYDRVNGKVHEKTQGNPFVIGTDDAYVRGNESKKVYIDTGFTPSQNTKVEIDFSLMATTTDARVLGTVTRNGLNMELRLYRTGKFFYNMQDDNLNQGVTTDVALDVDRHVFTLDGRENIALLTSDNGTITNYYTSDFSADMANTHTKEAATHLYVLGAGNGTSGTGGLRECDVKVYGMKIWDNGTLACDLTPRIVNGVAGLWDSKNSEFHGKTSDSVGDVRYGGAMESDADPISACTVTPQGGEVPVNGTLTLTASATGATGYQWFLDGEMIEGATGSSLAVEWTKNSRLVRTYKCLAFFNVFGYAESAAAVVTNAPSATVIYLR